MVPSDDRVSVSREDPRVARVTTPDDRPQGGHVRSALLMLNLAMRLTPGPETRHKTTKWHQRLERAFRVVDCSPDPGLVDGIELARRARTLLFEGLSGGKT